MVARRDPMPVSDGRGGERGGVPAARRNHLQSLIAALPRTLLGSLLAAAAVRSMAQAVGWLNARLIGHSVAWALPALAAATAGALLWRAGFGQLGKGTGTDVYIGALRGWGKQPCWQLGLAKLCATGLTVGSGGSGGLVGPALLIGASVMPRRPAVQGEHDAPGSTGDRALLAAGAAAGVAALWGAPIASALLACEVIFRQRVAWALLPHALVGGAVGTTIYRLGAETAPSTAAIPDSWALHLLLAAVAGAVAALLGLGLLAGLRAMERLQAAADRLPARGGTKLPWRSLGLMAAGGLAVVLVARLVGAGMLGFVPLQALVPWTAEASVIWPDMGLAVGKAVGTAATVGSGASGGVVGPALFIGAAAGRSVAAAFGACGLLLGAAGMAGCLAAVSNVPLAGAVLMVETLGPAAAPYALIGAAAGFWLARRWVAYSSLPLSDAAD